MAGHRSLLLINPSARRGREEGDRVRQLLAEAGIAVLAVETQDDTDLAEIIRTHAGKVRDVIIGGGDGTLNCAAPGLVDTGLPLGVLPLGTANDFARSVGIPLDLAEAVAVIANGRTGEVDVGMANEHLYFNVASVGFSAELAASLTTDAKKHWGKLGYAISAARLLIGSKMFTATIEHDGRTEKFRTFQVAVGNGRFYGGGMTVHADASPMDGKLDCYSLEVDRWWKLLWLLPALRRGTQGEWRDVRAFSTKGLTIRTRHPRPVNLDGELKTQTPVEFALKEKAVLVYLL